MSNVARMKYHSNQQRGSILLLVVFMLLAFVIISAASIQFIARQANQTVLQEQEEQAFEIADAGVNYTLWLLASAGGNFTPPQLVTAPPASTTNHAVTDQVGQTIGEFDLFFGPACSDSLAFRAVGYDRIKTNLCQVVDAKVKRFTSGEYKLIKWDHLLGYPCNQSYVPPSPDVCAPVSSIVPSPSLQASPSPLPTPSCNPTQCPSGWQCGSLGTCEPNSCDDIVGCDEETSCPPDHELVSGCSLGTAMYRDWSCCASCNQALQNFCGAIEGGYCSPTLYSEACSEEPTPTIPACTPSGTACTISGTICCGGLSCISGICGSFPTPTVPLITPPACIGITGACNNIQGASCCQGLSCVSGFCSPGAVSPII